MNRRVRTLLIGAAVCLAGAPTLGLYGIPGDADARPAAELAPAPVERAPVVEATAPAPVASVPTPAAAVAPALMTAGLAETSGISPEVLRLAVSAVTCGVTSGEIQKPPTLTVIDYSLPSVLPRLWVFDVATGKLLFKELVAHGRNTGDNMATRFSDTPESRQTSIGLFVTAETYVGSNGYSLRMDGLEPGFNARARERAIVMHGAPYVNASLASTQGRIGRSWGCPALRDAIARQVIDTVRGGGVVFSYYPDQNWLANSRFLNCGDTPATLLASN